MMMTLLLLAIAVTLASFTLWISLTGEPLTPKAETGEAAPPRDPHSFEQVLADLMWLK